jgi:hypothetical protein
MLSHPCVHNLVPVTFCTSVHRILPILRDYVITFPLNIVMLTIAYLNNIFSHLYILHNIYLGLNETIIRHKIC